MLDEASIVSKYLSNDPSILRAYLDWHKSNPFPWPPYFPIPDPRGIQNPWPGNDPNYGSKLLVMHGKIVDKFDNWRSSNGFKKLIPWNPDTRIPKNLSYPNRKKDQVKLRLPPWFTKFGSNLHEPATHNKKLAEFSSNNQLGTVMGWWKNIVHIGIGGDMASASKAPLDPIFWRFYKYIDNIYSVWEKTRTEVINSDVELQEPTVSEYSGVPEELIFGNEAFAEAFKKQYSKGKVVLVMRNVKKSSGEAVHGSGLQANSVVRLHIKILKEPIVFSIQQMVMSMQRLYRSIGISPSVATFEKLDRPNLEDVDTGTCTAGDITPGQEELFKNRLNVNPRDIVIYFVRSMNPPNNGCAVHPDGLPSCIISQGATIWTVAHEVGHVLGLHYHVDDNNRLMTGNGTSNITNPPPDITSDEITAMHNSDFVINL